MSFLRKVDLLVNPPLAIYFFTEMQSGNEKTRLQVERQDVVPPIQNLYFVILLLQYLTFYKFSIFFKGLCAVAGVIPSKVT